MCSPDSKPASEGLLSNNKVIVCAIAFCGAVTSASVASLASVRVNATNGSGTSAAGTVSSDPKDATGKPPKAISLVPRCTIVQSVYFVLANAVASTEADILTVPPFPGAGTRLKLNADFSLRPEIDDNVSAPHEIDTKTRVKWQMRRYRSNPTFGLLENKLLSHSLLSDMNIPQLGIYYGAFARKSLGLWPEYNRNDFISVLENNPAIVSNHLFVLKPISDGGFDNVLVMNHERWEKEDWTIEGLADFAEAFLFYNFSDWGMKHEHVGVMVQESILTNNDELEASFDTIEGFEGGLAKKASNVIEIKIHVVFGHLAGAEIMSVPCYGGLAIEIAFCGSDKFSHVRTREWWKPINGKHILELLEPRINTSQLQSIASRVAEAYGADWFRLDAFIDSQGTLFVNEVTYPSHNEHIDACTIPWLYGAYQNSSNTALEVVSSDDIMSGLLSRINITLEQFTRSSDYHVKERGSDEDYKDARWKWTPTNHSEESGSSDTDGTPKLSSSIFWFLLVIICPIFFKSIHVLSVGALHIIGKFHLTPISGPLPSTSDKDRWLLRYIIAGPICFHLAAIIFWKTFIDSFLLFLENIGCRFIAQVGVSLFLIREVIGTIHCSLTLRLLRKGLSPAELPQGDRLVHAIVIPQYKEPLDVLGATIESLALNSFASSAIIVLACEARDAEATKKADILKRLHGESFRDFIVTSHLLAPGEAIGKHSNENHACKELKKYALRKKIDPFNLMVTICDADSLFDSFYLEHLESAFCGERDGRRCLYNPGTSTTRNLSFCDFIVICFEIQRTVNRLLGLPGINFLESNYALTLGYLEEIGYWDVTVICEDVTISLRDAAHNNGIANVVPVYSIIVNDAVETVTDRWYQGQRHAWGIDTIAMVSMWYRHLRFYKWIALMIRTYHFETGRSIFQEIVWALPSVHHALRTSEEFQVLVLILFFSHVVRTVRFLIFYYCVESLLNNRRYYAPTSITQRIFVCLTSIVSFRLSFLLFMFCTSWERMIFAARGNKTMVYVVAPKDLHAQEVSMLERSQKQKKS